MLITGTGRALGVAAAFALAGHEVVADTDLMLATTSQFDDADVDVDVEALIQRNRGLT